MRELFTNIDTFHLADEDLSVLRNFDIRHCSDGVCCLSHDLRVQRTINNDDLPDLLCFRFAENVAAAFFEFRFHLVVDPIQNNDRLF